jgi:hypothetical protein
MIGSPVRDTDIIENTDIFAYLTFLEKAAHLPHYLLDNAHARLYTSLALSGKRHLTEKKPFTLDKYPTMTDRLRARSYTNTSSHSFRNIILSMNKINICTELNHPLTGRKGLSCEILFTAPVP